MSITVGMVVGYPSSKATPSGWVDLDNDNMHLKENTPTLAAFLGDTFGEAYNSETMFAMPPPIDTDNETGIKWIMFAG